MAQALRERQAMFDKRLNRRNVLAAAAMLTLGACSIVPKAPAPTPAPTPSPTQGTLPSDTDHHRIALLVPMSGSNGTVGQSLANAANMALLDTNAANLRVTTSDTSKRKSVV